MRTVISISSYLQWIYIFCKLLLLISESSAQENPLSVGTRFFWLRHIIWVVSVNEDTVQIIRTMSVSRQNQFGTHVLVVLFILVVLAVSLVEEPSWLLKMTIRYFILQIYDLSLTLGFKLKCSYIKVKMYHWHSTGASPVDKHQTILLGNVFLLPPGFHSISNHQSQLGHVRWRSSGCCSAGFCALPVSLENREEPTGPVLRKRSTGEVRGSNSR